MLNWNYYHYAEDLLNSKTHMLIAGASGSGKSYFVRELLHTMLCHSDRLVMLADPKCVDLKPYRRCKNVLEYQQNPDRILEMLNHAIQIMESRYADMDRQNLDEFSGAYIYIVIDELPDLLTSEYGKKIELAIQKLTQKGRASRVFVIMTSQFIHRSVLTARVVINVGTRVCLRCASAIESRMMIGRAGAELLPKYGEAYVQDAVGIHHQILACSPEQDRIDRIKYWS